MIEHLWTILCVKAIIEADTGALSLIEIIEDAIITVVGPSDERIAVPVDWTIVSTWARRQPDQPCKGVARVNVYAPAGEVLNDRPIEVEIDLSAVAKGRTIGKMKAFPLKGSGKYSCEISLKDSKGEWIPVGSYHFNIVIQETGTSAARG
jgi:hypothetical protein